MAWKSWGPTTHTLCLVCGGWGLGVWGLATEEFGFRVCGGIIFVYEAVAEAEAEAELGSPEASPSITKHKQIQNPDFQHSAKDLENIRRHSQNC